MKMLANTAAALALIAAVPAFAQIADFKHARRVNVVMTDHGFMPSTITLTHGAPVVLRFVNRSSRGHDFFSDGFFRDARVDPRDGGLIRDNKVDLDPGQTATLHVVAPGEAGARYPFHSSHLTDAASGLKGNIYIR